MWCQWMSNLLRWHGFKGIASFHIRLWYSQRKQVYVIVIFMANQCHHSSAKFPTFGMIFKSKKQFFFLLRELFLRPHLVDNLSSLSAQTNHVLAVLYKLKHVCWNDKRNVISVCTTIRKRCVLDVSRDYSREIKRSTRELQCNADDRANEIIYNK